MGIEQIGIGASTSPCIRTFITIWTHVREEFAIDVIGILGIVQSGIEIDAPTRTPTCSLVTFQFEGLGGSTMDVLFRVHTIIDVVPRIDTEEVTLVTMVRVFIFPIIEPLLQITLLSYLVGM